MGTDLLAITEFARQIDEGDVAIVAQPIVDLARAHIVGYEALSRFPTTKGLGVEGWFSLAERSGLGPRLESMVLDKALGLRADLPTNCFLTVNVSPSALLTECVQDVIAGAGTLEGVVIELTEHNRIDDLDAVAGVLADLRGLGAMVAIDDAGAGHSGLRHILALRPDLLKIDRSLVSDIDVDEVKRSLVSMLGVFADRADAWLLAEGIETEAELGTVIDLGVPLGQGWKLARPKPPWVALDPEVRRFMRDRLDQRATTPRSRFTAAAVMEVARWVDRSDSGMPCPSRPVVIVDRHRRPLALAEPVAGAVVERPLTKVHADTETATLARRMLARPPAERYGPVAVVDGAGRYLGLVRWERLTEHLVDRVDEVAAATAATLDAQ